MRNCKKIKVSQAVLRMYKLMICKTWCSHKCRFKFKMMKNNAEKWLYKLKWIWCQSLKKKLYQTILLFLVIVFFCFPFLFFLLHFICLWINLIIYLLSQWTDLSSPISNRWAVSLNFILSRCYLNFYISSNH